MSTSKEYKEFILEQLECLKEITIRPMMGEYLLYYQGILFGGIYDNQLLLKRTSIALEIDPSLIEQIPYPSAKPMYLIETLEDKELLKDLITKTCDELSSLKK